MKKSLLFIILSCFTLVTSAQHIIFDLGGVLVTSSKFKAARSIGVKNFMTYFFKYGHYPREVVGIMMDIMDTLEPLPSSHTNEPYTYWRSAPWRPLPMLCRSWLAGTITSEEIRQRVLDKIRELDTTSYFSSAVERKLVEQTVISMFTPQLMVRAARKIKGGIHLARELAAQGHTLYILSNWDRQSFELLYNDPKYASLFSLFPRDRIIISAEVHDYKPHASFFDYLLKRFNLDPAECIFLDDQEENIKTAQNMGITTHRIVKKSFRLVRQQFKKEGLL